MDARPKAKTVDGILQKLDTKNRKLTEQLRALTKKTLPKAVETVKWGNITYLVAGKNISWLIAYKDHMDFGFFVGTKLKSNRLEGSGKGLRHIKVQSDDDIDEKEFSRLLLDAVKLT
ncbi:MAG: DUF1801 domain-containing protein [Thaumarchaeota archaeon]|nr:DUF1801 domain-containing protein [Nitrososphaerota archaeon]